MTNTQTLKIIVGLMQKAGQSEKLLETKIRELYGIIKPLAVVLRAELPDVTEFLPKENKPIYKLKVSNVERDKRIKSLLEKAESLDNKAYEKRNSGVHSQNWTHRRSKIAAGMDADAQVLERKALILRAIADGLTNNNLSPVLSKINTVADLDDLRATFFIVYPARIDEATFPHYDSSWRNDSMIEDEKKRIKKFTALGISNTEEYRKALHEIYYFYLNNSNDYEARAERAKKERELNEKLHQINIPGFFPTPAELVDEMLEMLDSNYDVKSQTKFLEPSAGKGDIAKGIRREYPNNQLDVCELNSTLKEVLKNDDFNVVAGDFLEFNGKYDVILMNPPYEKKGAEIHVTHAFECLNSDGILISIVPSSFNSDKIEKQFQDKYSISEISDNMNDRFKAAFRSTGVSVKIFMMKKNSEPQKRSAYPVTESGEASEIITASETIPCTYALYELDDLIPSHNWENYTVNKAYPVRCQERQYNSDKSEQNKVEGNAKNFNAKFLLSDDPTPENGPSVVTTDGIVLGGNGRIMTLNRVRAYYPELWKEYQTALRKRLAVYSLSENAYGLFKSPVLVRIVDVNINKCSHYSWVLNTSAKQEGDVNDRAVAYARELTTRAFEELGRTIEAAEVESFAEILRTPQTVRSLIKILSEQTIINDRNRSKWIDGSTNLFTKEGNLMIEAILLSALLSDKKIIESAKLYANKILKNIPYFLRLKKIHNDWNFIPAMEEAIKLESARQSKGWKKSEFLGQRDAFTAEYPADVLTVWDFLDLPQSKFKAVLSKYIEYAERESGNDAPMWETDKLEPMTVLTSLMNKSDGLSDDLSDVNEINLMVTEPGEHAEQVSGLSSLSDIRNIKSVEIPLYNSKIRELFGRLCSPFRMLIWGRPGQGKSTFSLMLADDLGRTGKILYFMTEEKLSSGRMSDRIKKLGITSKNLIFDDRGKFWDLVDDLNSNPDIKYVIIDSTNALGKSRDELSALAEEFSEISFIYIVWSDKVGKTYAGKTSEAFLVDTTINVNSGLAETMKHRDAPIGKKIQVFTSPEKRHRFRYVNPWARTA